MTTGSNWSGKAGALQSEIQQQTPLVEVVINVFGTDKGQCEIRVRPHPQGAFAGLHGTGQARAAAWAQLLTLIQREVQQAFQPGALGGPGPSRPPTG